MTKNNLIVVLGPTASGKTHLGVKLAEALGGEIISADSRQVYRGLDLGSGKDLHEYGNTPYHLIDIVDPGHEFNVFEYQQCFCNAYSDVISRARVPLLVGGTGMYLDAILSKYEFVRVPENPKLREQLKNDSMASLTERLLRSAKHIHNSTDTVDRERLIRAIEIAEAQLCANPQTTQLPEFNPIVLGVKWERDVLKKRILARLKERLEQGLIEEVRELNQRGVSWELLYFYGLEYRFVAAYLQGQLNRNDMVQKLNAAIYTFAKQQEKWFRKMERKGITIHWLDLHASDDIVQQSLAIIGRSAID